MSHIVKEFEAVLIQSFFKKPDVVQLPETIQTAQTEFCCQARQHTVPQNKHSPWGNVSLDSNAVPHEVLVPDVVPTCPPPGIGHL